MKAFIFFIEDDGPNELTDFDNIHDMQDLMKHFNCSFMDFERPSTARKLEALEMMFKGGSLDSKIIKDRLFTHHKT